MMQWNIDTTLPNLGWGSLRITYEAIAIWYGSVHALAAVSLPVSTLISDHPNTQLLYVLRDISE